ncbi:MAG: type IV pilus secretin PilQ [Candidatus Omnitrophica bacterium]|nr:type IV pilus secretin PilQ [Candidatus Omnitrophota bacterium]
MKIKKLAISISIFFFLFLILQNTSGPESLVIAEELELEDLSQLFEEEIDVEIFGLEDEVSSEIMAEELNEEELKAVEAEFEEAEEIFGLGQEEEALDIPEEVAAEILAEELPIVTESELSSELDQLEPAGKKLAEEVTEVQEGKTQEEELPVTKVSLDFKEADIRNVLRILSYKSGVNIVASPEVTGLVTIRLTDVPWDKALDVVLDTYGFGHERKENIITVYPMEMLTARKSQEQALAAVQPTVTKVIKLKFIDATDMKKALDPQLSPRGRVTVLEATGQAGWEFGGSELGKRARIGEKTSRSKMLIISDIPPVLERLEEVIAELDVRPEQVLIEVRLLEVNRDKLSDLGMEWGTGSDGTGFIETSGKGLDGSSETQLSVQGETLQVSPSTFSSKSGFSGITPFNAGLTATFQKITGSQFQAILHAVAEDVEVNTLSAPRILTLSDQEATILIGSKYPILTSDVSTEAGATVTTTLDYYEDIGIQLNVVPQVNDDGYINLIVHPAVTSISSYIGDNSYPVIITREAETQLLIKDGETIVIGGLLKDVKGESEIGIPFLSKIPILGFLFRRTVVDIEKIDLLIFITARVVKSEGDLITFKQSVETPVRNLIPAEPVIKEEE